MLEAYHLQLFYLFKNLELEVFQLPIEQRKNFLKKKFKFLNIISWESLELEINNFDIINATSLGLKNGEDFNSILKIQRRGNIY